MNSGEQDNANANASDDLLDHLQVAVQHVSPIRLIRELSSAVNDNNDGFPSSSSCSCFHYRCESHNALTMGDYFDSLPVGYRFSPTDQELVTEYLLKKIKNENLPKNKIGDVDVYGNHPERIVENQPEAKEGQWYFFSPRTRKHATGTRPVRKAGNSYWKATRLDQKLRDENRVIIGAKKYFEYYEGNPPNGKTDWLMEEYVVADHQRQRLSLEDMKLDDYVLCKIYKSENGGRRVGQEQVVEAAKDADENPTAVRVANNVEIANNVAVQDSNPAVLPVENNMAVQDSSPTVLPVENNGAVQDSNPAVR